MVMQWTFFLDHDNKSRKYGIGLLWASNAWNEEHMKATFVKKKCFTVSLFCNEQFLTMDDITIAGKICFRPP